jgi:hypothetical protein
LVRATGGVADRLLVWSVFAGMAQFVTRFADPDDPEYAPPVPTCETRVSSSALLLQFVLNYRHSAAVSCPRLCGHNHIDNLMMCYYVVWFYYLSLGDKSLRGAYLGILAPLK